MKKILSLILFLFLAIGAQAQTYYTFSVSVTNVPANGATIANGTDTRTWTTGSITTPATQIAVAANPTLCASNLFFQTAQYQFLGSTPIWDGGTNLTYSGTNLAITASSGWATVTVVSTNSSSAIHVDVNASGSYGLNGSVANQVFMASGVVDGINKAATNQFSSTAYAMQNYLALSTPQTVTGAKTFNGIITGTNQSNSLNGLFVGNFNGGILISAGSPAHMLLPVNATGDFFYGEDLVSTNSNSLPVIFLTSTDYTLPLAQWSVVPNPASQALGGSGNVKWTAVVSNVASAYYIALVQTNLPFPDFNMLQLTSNAGPTWTVTFPNDINVGYNIMTGSIGIDPLGGGTTWFDGFNQPRAYMESGGVFAINGKNGRVPGINSQTSWDGTTNINIASYLNIMAGFAITGNGFFLTTLNSTNLTGFIQQAQVTTNLNYQGGFFGVSTNTTNIIAGQLIIPSGSVSSLINSNNQDIVIGTNSYVQFSGPSGAFYIAGIAGGVDGRVVTIENTSGQTMVVGNNGGGFESTAANRINTLTGSDLNPVNVFTIRYDGTASRWKVISSR